METNFKVGQRVMILGTVERVKKNGLYPILVQPIGGVGAIAFTGSGKFSAADIKQNLFPYTEPFREREMMVWNDYEGNAIKRTVVSNFNGKFQTISTFGDGGVYNWKNAKEIEQPEEKKETETFIDLLFKFIEQSGYNVTKK